MSATVASCDLYNDDSASPMTMNRPTGTASGDLLLAVVVQDSGVIGDLTPATGFTANGTVVNNTGQFAKVYTKVAGGSEPATYDFAYNSGAATAGLMYRITGADSTPTIVVSSNYVNSNLATFDSLTATPSGSDDLEIVILTNSGGGATFSYAVPSGGYTDRGKTQASTSFQGIAAADRQLASSSATGNQTWSSISPTSRQAGSFNILVKSAASAGATYNPQRTRGSWRRLVLPRRPDIGSPVPAQQAQLTPAWPNERTRATWRRIVAYRRAIARVAEPVPTAVVVVVTTIPVAARREPVRLPIRAPRARTQALPPQPDQLEVTVRRRTPPPMRVRSPRVFVAAPPQGAQPTPAYVPVNARQRRPVPLLIRHSRSLTPPLAQQVLLIYPVPTTVRARPGRPQPIRYHRTASPPVPVSAPPPVVLVPSAVRSRRASPLVVRHLRSTSPPLVVAPVVVTQPPTAVRPRVSPFRLVRHAATPMPVPPQVVLVTVWPPARYRPRPTLAPFIRRPTAPTAPRVERTPAVSVRRPVRPPLRARPRTGRPLPILFPTANPPFLPVAIRHRVPPIHMHRPRAVRVFATCVCVTTRPGGGTTFRVIGTTVRPNSGITEDPCC
jgi:hypothetical protein